MFESWISACSRGPIDLVSFLLARYDGILASLKNKRRAMSHRSESAREANNHPHNYTSNSSAELGAPKALLRKTGERETASLFQNGFAIW